MTLNCEPEETRSPLSCFYQDILLWQQEEGANIPRIQQEDAWIREFYYGQAGAASRVMKVKGLSKELEFLS